METTQLETLVKALTEALENLRQQEMYKDKYLELKELVEEKMLSQSEVADMVGVVDKVIMDERKAGGIQAVLIGKRWMFKMSEVVRFKKYGSRRTGSKRIKL